MGGGACLFDLPGIALIGARNIISQCLRAGEIVVRAWGGDNVALAGDLAGKAGDWAGDLVDLAEEEDAGEAAVWLSAVGRRQSKRWIGQNENERGTRKTNL